MYLEVRYARYKVLKKIVYSIQYSFYLPREIPTILMQAVENMLERWNGVPRKDIKVSNFSQKVLDAKCIGYTVTIC